MGESDLPETEAAAGGLDQLASLEPRPEQVAIFAEDVQRLMDSLGSETLQKIALMRLAKYQVNEIAAELRNPPARPCRGSWK